MTSFENVPVSVVMPVYNGARFLDQAIESICTQTYRNFEFIIVDDGSKDATPEILRRHAADDSRIQVLSQEVNRGYIDALHRGFAAATGKYIARMDQDDLAKPYRLEMQLGFLAANPSVVLVGGAIEIIDAESRVVQTVFMPSQPEELRRDLRLYGNAIAHPTVLFQRRVVEEVGGFRNAYKAAEDYDLWLRMMEKFDLANVREVLLGYRRHEGSISWGNAKQQALSALCARVTAEMRLQGSPDPTSGMNLITEATLRDLGVRQEVIHEAVFKNMLGLTEDAIRCRVPSAAAEFIRAAKPHVTAEKLAHVSLKLNRKAALVPASDSEKRRHRTMLLAADPAVYWALFRTGMAYSHGADDSTRRSTRANADEPQAFSVVIPVYNHVKYARQAVMSALRSPIVSEVIVVDDGSIDGSANLLAQLAAAHPKRVRDITKPGDGNRGAHNRLNELVAAAKCNWVAVLNSDDVFVDGRFEAIVSNSHFSRSDFAFGNLLLIDQIGRLFTAKRGPLHSGTPFPQEFDLAKMLKDGDVVDLLAHQNCIGTTSNMIFTKNLHARIGGFAAFRYVHDWDFALRAAILAQCLYIPRYLTAYRVHGTNTINEASSGVKAESNALFVRLSEDFPQVAQRQHFQVGLRENVILNIPKSDNCKANSSVASHRE